MVAKPPKPQAKRSKTGWWWMKPARAMPYTYSTVEVLDEETGAVTARKLIIVADPVRNESGAIVYGADGQPLYEARSLLLSRELLDAIVARGYTHIRFVVKDAALEWPIAEMTEDGYAVRLAPMEADELSQAEKDATGEAETLTGSYRARITAMIEGEETDVTNAIPGLTAIFGAQSVRELADGETAQLLLVPGDGEPEVIASAVQYIEATQAENARYEAPLPESGPVRDGLAIIPQNGNRAASMRAPLQFVSKCGCRFFRYL